MQGRAGDHRLGEASSPESVAHDPRQVQTPAFVAAGQQICQGDIVTMNDDGIVRVESAETSGDGMNWGDVSGGAYVALCSVDTLSKPSRPEPIGVLAPGAHIVSILDAGVPLSSRMGVDFRAVEGDKRVDRKDPVTWSTDHRQDSRLWQRTRMMSEEDMRDSVRKKAFLGRLEEILSGNCPHPAQSEQGDYGRIRLQSQTPA